jgi:hypothetical protein
MTFSLKKAHNLQPHISDKPVPICSQNVLFIATANAVCTTKWFNSSVSSTHYKKAWHWFRATCLLPSPFTLITQLMNADNATCGKLPAYAQCPAQSSPNLRPYPLLIHLPGTFCYSDHQLSMKHPNLFCRARNGKLCVQALYTRTNTAKTTTTNDTKNSNTIPHNC